jgi:hypothetical protein
MTDEERERQDLLDKLRNVFQICEDAADAIEQLAKEVEHWKKVYCELADKYAERRAGGNAEPEWNCATQGCKNADTIEGLTGCAVKYRAKIKELEAALVQSLAQSDAEPTDKSAK